MLRYLKMNIPVWTNMVVAFVSFQIGRFWPSRESIDVGSQTLPDEYSGASSPVSSIGSRSPRSPPPPPPPSSPVDIRQNLVSNIVKPVPQLDLSVKGILTMILPGSPETEQGGDSGWFVA